MQLHKTLIIALFSLLFSSVKLLTKNQMNSDSFKFIDEFINITYLEPHSFKSYKDSKLSSIEDELCINAIGNMTANLLKFPYSFIY